MTQLENLAENELDIVATFMGHDIRVHREFYRLPKNTLQLAKMGKLISSKEKGIALDEEEFDSIENIELSEEDDIDDDLKEMDDLVDDSTNAEIISKRVTKKQKNACKKKTRKAAITKKPWSTEEISIIKNTFSMFLNVNYLPSKHLIDKCMAEYAILRLRKWTHIKDKIRYLQKKNK